jgi:hypothetical protein
MGKSLWNEQLFLFSADSKTEKCFPKVGESLRKSTAIYDFSL